MSESARARERLDFEAAAEVIEKGKNGPLNATYSSQQLHEISASANLQFTSGSSEVGNHLLIGVHGITTHKFNYWFSFAVYYMGLCRELEFLKLKNRY